MGCSSSHIADEASPPADAVRLDRQTIVVILVAALLGMWRSTFGSPEFFDHHLSRLVGAREGDLMGYAYFFVTQAIVGFVIPVTLLTAIFKRRPREIGLALGDVKFGLLALALSIPLLTAGCWLLSQQGAFQGTHPMWRAAVSDRGLFLLYEILFLLYFVGWEYLWRGFLLFGTAPAFGRYAIFIQMLPFAALHATKPAAEAYLSIAGALLIGAVVWRCRSFWIAVPIHAYQMFVLDLFCAYRAAHL